VLTQFKSVIGEENHFNESIENGREHIKI